MTSRGYALRSVDSATIAVISASTHETSAITPWTLIQLSAPSLLTNCPAVTAWQKIAIDVTTASAA